MDTLLCHEWVAPTGGSENVFEVLISMMPAADKLVLWNDAPARFGRDLRETVLARTAVRRSKALAVPFMPTAWRLQELASYDRVVVSSHAFSHHVAGRAARLGIPAFAYVHTPARYVWAPEMDSRGQSALARLGRSHMQRLDRRAIDTRVRYAANSHFVRDRIRSSWGVDADVIYPPVDVERLRSVPEWEQALDPSDSSVIGRLPAEFVFGASRMVPYKRLDDVIRVGRSLDLPVVLAGEGPDEARLREIAQRTGVRVSFVGRVSTPLLYALYQKAALFVFTPVEDFGIMPVEAMTVGTPVLVNAVGGAREAVSVLGMGAVADVDDPTSLHRAAREAIALRNQAKPSDYFSEATFRNRVTSWLEDSM